MYYGLDIGITTLRNWTLPWLLLLLYVCLGKNMEMGLLYDYTLFHMVVGILIGRLYAYTLSDFL